MRYLAQLEELVETEKTIFTYTGVLFRFLDYVRCYVKPSTDSEKHFTAKYFVFLTGQFPKADFYSPFTDDFRRSILHHVADVGLEPDLVLDILRYKYPDTNPCKNLMNAVDELGRTADSIIASKLAVHMTYQNLYSI